MDRTFEVAARTRWDAMATADAPRTDALLGRMLLEPAWAARPADARDAVSAYLALLSTALAYVIFFRILAAAGYSGG